MHSKFFAVKRRMLLRTPQATVLATLFVFSIGFGIVQNVAAQTESTSPEVSLTDQGLQQTLTDTPQTQSVVQPLPYETAGDGYLLNDPVAAKPKTDEAAKKKAAALKKRVASAYKTVFYDNDFSYLCDSAYEGCLLGEGLKRRGLPSGGWYDIGGQFRTRYHAERNMRGLGLTGVDDDFLLHRTRIYGDFHFTPNIRVYAEMLNADSNYENNNPRPIEVNRTEMQNLFVDARLIARGDQSLTARIGRQEMILGAQRNVSALDWANTRRTFEGVRMMMKGKDHKVDAFWVNPMRVDDSSLDSPDRDQEFMGIYSTYTGCKNRTFETFFLRALNGRGANNYEYNTVGTRWQGSQNDFLWEFEGAYQFGDNTDGSSHVAGMATFGLGRKFSQHCWNPTLWMYYDWASGDDATGAGNGYHHNFPLAHKYNGFMDFYGRRNLEDVNLQFSVQPTKKLKLLAWYHYFFLETQTDTPYSVAMTPFNGGNLPGSADLGHEIDLIASYKVSQRQNLVLGYSHFFSGEYYDTTPGVPFNGDADFFYAQWTTNF